MLKTPKAGRRWLLAAPLLLLTVEARGQLVLDPPSLDFGERGHNERPEATVLLRNTGTSSLVVREMRKSCDCLTVSPDRLPSPIPPGQTFPLRISMGSGRAMGRLDKKITVVVTGDAKRPEVVLPVFMRVLEGYQMEPREVRLEGVVGGKPVEASVEVRRRRAEADPPRLEVKAVRSLYGRPSSSHLRAQVESIPGGRRMVVELDPTHPEGPISAEVEASLDGKALIVPVMGEMFAWIKVTPNFINFSAIQASDPSSSRREILLESTDGTPFSVLAVSSRPHRPGEPSVRLEIRNEPQPPATEGASTSHKLVCRAERGAGPEPTFFGTVTVTTDHPRKPQISLRYSGFFKETPKGAPGQAAGEARKKS